MSQTVTETQDWEGIAQTAVHRLEQLEESLAALELERQDEAGGWVALLDQHRQEFSREAIVRHAQQHRVLSIANPLIRRGCQLTASYALGQGVGTTVEGEAANAVVQEWLDDPTVRRVFTGAEANERNDIALSTDGNLFFALPTNPLTGETTIRDIPLEEITQIITTPGDRERVQYYVREWSERNSQTGQWQKMTAAYPELRYSPVTKQRRIRLDQTRTAPVQWDAPVLHVAPNKAKGHQWGTADAFTAAPWAKGYSTFLNDWARLVKALSKIAFQKKGGKPSEAQKTRAELEAMYRGGPGQTAVSAGEGSLEAVPKTGATIDSESGRPLAAMVAAAFGIPVTTLMSDPGQTGARAVAETLDFPTRLRMGARQEVWREARRQILEYVLLQAVKAPRGALRRQGRIVRKDDREHVTWAQVGYGTITIDFPPLDDLPVEVMTAALEKADHMQKLPPLLIAKLLARALRVRDVDEVLSQVTDQDGNFVSPYATAGAAAGQAAADALRRGGNPADYL